MDEERLPDVSIAELINAFCDLLDGVQDHDIQSMTGLSNEDCERIIRVRKSVIHLWDVNNTTNS